MPLLLPNLDDRSYSDLVDEARALIPSFYPGWTDHNPSDVGITLVELLAWLTEMVIYRVNRVTDEHLVTFLTLLTGSDQSATDDLDAAIRQTVLGLRQRYRAVTCDDWEYLATVAWAQTPEARALGTAGIVRRAHCLPARNLDLANPQARLAPAPGHVSLVVLGDDGAAPAAELHDGLARFLDARRLLGTRQHLVGPAYVPIGLTATLVLREDAAGDPETAEAARVEAARRVRAFFDPLSGGPDGGGWPFGRDVHASEILALLDGVPSVNYVAETPGIVFTAPPGRVLPAPGLSKVRLEAHELVEMEVSRGSFTTV